MKLKIIGQNDSVYSDFGLSLDITIEKWREWDDEVRRRHREAEKTGNYEGIYDTDECGECGIVSRRTNYAAIKSSEVRLARENRELREELDKYKTPKAAGQKL